MKRRSYDNLKLRKVLVENDRRGERTIAYFQALIAIIVFGFHLLSASNNQWNTFSSLTIGIAICILLLCAVRFWLAGRPELPKFWLNILTVIDGCFIYALIISYSYAYDLPVASSLKAPSIIFLVLYTGSRVVKLDPIALAIAGTTVVCGWFLLIFYAVINGTELTHSYQDHVTTNKLLIGANIEMAVGFVAVTVVLVATSVYARRILANTADIEELETAKLDAENMAVRHAALFESSSDGILVVDEFGTIERVNNSLEKMFGYSASELIGKSVAVLMSNENAMKLAQDILSFRQNGHSALIGSPFDSEGKRFDGRLFPIELSISDFKVAGKLHFTGIVRDITSRVQVAQNERAALTKFEEVVTSALDAIVVIDEEGLVVEFNPAAEEIFGFKRSEMIGKDMGQTIVPTQHRAAHRNGMQHYLKTGEGPVLNQRIEIDAVRADGRSIMIELAIKDCEYPDGRLFFGYMRDITEKKAKELELIEAKDRAEIANRAKASFLAMMSHEIRTPLNGVLGILTLLSDSVKDIENAKLVYTARRSGRSLLAIINDILDFSKLEAGKLDLEIGSFYTDILVDSVHSLTRQQARQKNLMLSFSVDDDVHRILLGDQDRIRQVLLNLVWNAVKFTETGSVEIRLKNCDLNGRSGVRFSVTDTGVGVPEGRENELFTEFATIDPSYARKFGGTGLGLSICKALTEAMDGQIGYKPNEPEGSIFWFELPLQAGDENAVGDEDLVEVAQNVLEDLNSVRLLLAEDNVTNQLVVGNILERLGCVVDIVSTGQEAIDGILARNYDAILMDVSMPEMDGITATKIIRQLDGEVRNTPIIALTAYALDEDRQRVLAAGMNDFVAKPISRIELARAIARQVSGKDYASVRNDIDAKRTSSLFDEDVLAGILADMDDETVAKIVVEFRKDIQRHLKALNDAVLNVDEEMFERGTHGLKGVSGTFGATELSRLTSEANSRARKGEVPLAFAMKDEIETLANATIDSVEQRFGPAQKINDEDAK